MNRIVIIGNGFDLAHGLETSYKHFIDYLWEKEKEIITKNKLAYCHGYLDSSDYHIYNSAFIEIRSTTFSTIKENFANGYGYAWFKDLKKRGNIRVVEFQNTFLETICKEVESKKWVDIEAEYYHELKMCLNNKRTGGIKKLNEEFSKIKTALEMYLEKLQKNVLSDGTIGTISQHLKMTSYSGKPIDNVIFLNFNYTSTIDHYKNSNDLVIYIHGKLNDPNNPIIFGYADELDENYKQIENKNDNEYLKNMKSMEYLKTGNNTKLQALIDSDEYEIFIMGHSCGISDRTLLKNVFEHKNCRSIRIFYHKDNNSDNYIDLVNNISRIFDDKNTMWRKVVSKNKCVPLL